MIDLHDDDNDGVGNDDDGNDDDDNDDVTFDFTLAASVSTATLQQPIL
jgi:hypothetical protein